MPRTSRNVFVENQSLLGNYETSNVDESGDPKYYGFVDRDGNWYIMRNTSGTDFAYSRGITDYSTNWTNRAALSYDSFSNVF